MPAEIKNIFLSLMQDPEFEKDNPNRNEAAWETAWKRMRQLKRNEKALTLIKQNLKKFLIAKQATYMTGLAEGVPKNQYKIGKPSKFPPELANKEMEYSYEQNAGFTDIKGGYPPKTAIERLKEVAQKEI